MAIAYVIDVEAGASGGAPNATTSGSTDTTGCDFFVMCLETYVPGTTAAPSDSKGNTWNALTLRTTTTVEVQLFWCVPTSVGSGHTFTGTGTTGYTNVMVIGFSGVKQTSPADQENGATTALATSLATGSVTPSENGEVIVTGVCLPNSPSFTNDSSFTETADIAFAGGNHFGTALAYQIQTTATARNVTWTGSGSNDEGAAAIATFKAEAAAANSDQYFFSPFVFTKRNRIIAY